MSLIREMKRRHVFRMALLYLVPAGLRGLQRGAGGARMADLFERTLR